MVNLVALMCAAEKLNQDSPSVTVDAVRCLHRWNKDSQCDICVQACPTQAIRLDGPVHIDADACIKCGLCLHQCPTGVFTGRNSTYRLLHAAEQLVDRQVVEVACKLHPNPEIGERGVDAVLVTNGCLVELGASAYVGLRAVGVEKVRVRLDACAECPMGMQRQIEKTIAEAGSLLGGEAQISASQPARRTQKRPTYSVNNPPMTRRGFFKTLAQQDESLAAQITAYQESVDGVRIVPRERQWLLNALHALGVTHDEMVEGDYVSLSVSSACTGCAVCARSCPTNVLQFERERDAFKLTVMIGDCVDCGLCMTYCEPDAIHRERNATLREIVNSAPVMLYEGELRYRCKQCGAPSAVPLVDDLCAFCTNKRKNLFGSIVPKRQP